MGRSVAIRKKITPGRRIVVRASLAVSCWLAVAVVLAVRVDEAAKDDENNGKTWPTLPDGQGRKAHPAAAESGLNQASVKGDETGPQEEVEEAVKEEVEEVEEVAQKGVQVQEDAHKLQMDEQMLDKDAQQLQKEAAVATAAFPNEFKGGLTPSKVASTARDLGMKTAEVAELARDAKESNDRDIRDMESPAVRDMREAVTPPWLSSDQARRVTIAVLSVGCLMPVILFISAVAACMAGQEKLEEFTSPSLRRLSYSQSSDALAAGAPTLRPQTLSADSQGSCPRRSKNGLYGQGLAVSFRQTSKPEDAASSSAAASSQQQQQQK